MKTARRGGNPDEPNVPADQSIHKEFEATI